MRTKVTYVHVGLLKTTLLQLISCQLLLNQLNGISKLCWFSGNDTFWHRQVTC